MCSVKRGLHSLQKWSCSTGERQQLFKVWLYSNYKEVFTFSNGEDQSGLWGKKVFLLKKCKHSVFPIFFSGQAFDVDVMERSRCSSLSRMMAKMFPPFTVLPLMKIIFTCALLQTHCYSLILGTSLTSSENVISEDSLGHDQMYPYTLKRILKCVCFVGQWWATLPPTQ